MGRYCFVVPANPTSFINGSGKRCQTRTDALLYKCGFYSSEMSPEAMAYALYGVRKNEKTFVNKGIFGLQHKEKHTVYEPFFIICEEQDDKLVDVITGREYESVKNVSSNFKDCSSKLKLKKVHEASSSLVARFLRSLTEEDICRYISGIDKLEEMIAQGYQEDIALMNAEEIINKQNEAYIKSFKNQYRK